MAQNTDNPRSTVTPEAKPPAEVRPGRRNWLRVWFRTLSLTLLVLLLVILWVLGTQSGLRFSLSLVEELAPSLLRVERAEGRILGDLHIRGLQVRTPGLQVRLSSLDLRWNPLGAVTGTLRISELSVRELDVALAPLADDEEPGPIELPPVVLPLQLVLEQALVEDLSIGELDDDARFRVDRIRMAASWLGSELSLKELAVALPDPLLEANARGEAKLTGDYPLDFALAWSLSREPALVLEGKAELSGDLEELHLEHDLTGSARVELQALVREVLEGPSWEGKLSILSVDLPSIQPDLPAVDLSGELTTSGSLEDARVQGIVSGEAPSLPDFGRLGTTLDVTWRGRVLEIAVLELNEQDSGALLTIDGELDLTDSPGRFDLQAAWEKLRWPLAEASIAEVRQGRLDVGGTLEAFRYEVSAEVWGRDFPEASLRLSGDGSPEATRIQGLSIETLDGKIEAEGRVAWAPELGWELTLTADGIDSGVQWPDLPARVGFTLASRGDLNAFVYSLEADMQSHALPASTLALKGQGDTKGTRLETLRVETLGGHLQAKADVAWAPAVTWDAEVDIADLDPGKQWPEWGGVLGGRVLSHGKLTDEGPELSARVESLGGRLRGYPVDAEARVRMRGRETQLEELRVVSGPSSLTASGSIGERLDLELGFSSPNLESLLPDAQGSIKVSGTATGILDTPAMNLELAADGVAVAGQRIRSLGGTVQVDLAPNGRLNVDLTGAGLVAGAMAFDSLRIRGDGDRGSHRLIAKVTGEPLALDLEAAGGLEEDNAYAGRLERLELRTRDFGEWRLQKAAPFALSGAQIDAGPFCIRDQAGSGGCADFAQQEAGSWSASLDQGRLSFQVLTPFVPDGLVLEGEARAMADFKAAGGTLRGRASVQVPKGVLSAESGRGEEHLELLNFTATNLSVDADAASLQAKLEAPLVGLGDLSADLALPGWSLDGPARPNQPVRGSVRARVDDLGIVSRLAPDVRNLTGDLNADFKLGGTFAKPAITGAARLAGGGFEVPFIGLQIEDLSFDADAKGLDRIEYSGGFRAGDGRLEIDGQSLMSAAGLSTRIGAKGDKLRLADTSEYFVLASPDIQVEFTPTGIDVNGSVKVPEARIRPRSIPAGAVSPSPDVVIASEDQEERPLYARSIDLRLELGNKVTVNAFGLEGSIEGELGVLQAPGQEILGNGELKIVDGTYRIPTGGKLSAVIGKPLIIEQGILSYVKSPINNPFLVLTAQREGGDITASLRVFGTIKNPKMTFFSATDPGMSPSEVTTYLLTGIPPGRGADQSGDQALSLGTYLTPELFAEYDHSLGDQADKIKLRYDLNDWIQLQTETGDSQGGDIFFKIEN